LTLKKTTAISKIKGKGIWITATLVILITAGWYYYSKVNIVVQVPGGSQTQTTVVRQGDLVLSTKGTGSLISQTDATFGFGTSGQVTQADVKVGDQVEAGQVLAQLDDTLSQMSYVEAQQALQELFSATSIATVENEIATAQDTKASARAWLGYLLSPAVVDAEENLASGEQRLTEAQAEAKANPSEAANQKVKESQSAVAYLKDELTQAQVAYKDYYLPQNFTEYKTVGSGRRRKQVVVTEIDPVTGKEVPKIDGPSIDDIATARNNYAQAKQTIKDGETYLNVLKTGVIPADSTGSQLNSLNDAQLAVDNAQAELDKTKLIAPISGIVTAMDIRVGEQGNTTSAITISQLQQPYQLDTNIDGNDWSMAKTGNKVNVTFDLLPDKTFPGTVTLVYPVLNSSSDTPLAHILVQLDQSISQNLPAGATATIEVIGGEVKNALLVPTSSIHKTSDGGYAVYLIQNGKKAEQPIEIGLRGTSYVEVKSGIQAGAAVVTK